MRSPTLIPFLLVAACAPTGSPGTPLESDGPPELLFCRSRSADAFGDTQLRTSTARGLGDVRIIDRPGVESGVRVAPDGNSLVFARERRSGERESQELLTAPIDGSSDELRLTVDGFFDAKPCWSGDGEWIAFESERLEAGPRIIVIRRDGKDAKPLFDDGADQGAPDWSWSRDRIAFEHVDPTGRSQIWTVDPAGRDALPLTTGGSGTAANGTTPGDHDPTWAPDGTSLLFVRDVEPGLRILMQVDFASRATTQLTLPDGMVESPRWSPHTDRIFFVGDRPASGIVGRRLWLAGPDGSDRRMLFLDVRQQFIGIEVLPAIAPVPSGAAETLTADMARSSISNSLGNPSRGVIDNVIGTDGLLFGLATGTSGGRQIAGIEFEVPLPVTSAQDALGVEFRVAVSLTEIDPTSVIRLSLANFVDFRNDTVVEFTPRDDRMLTLSFSIASLQHVSSDGRVRLAVVGENAVDHPGELLIDSVAVSVTRPQQAASN